MQVSRRPRSASSVAIRASMSSRQPRESRSQSRRVGVRSGGKRLERGADPLERDAGGAAGLDERDPPEGRALVPALVSARPSRGDQSLALVEAERRGGDAAAGGELADRQLVAT